MNFELVFYRTVTTFMLISKRRCFGRARWLHIQGRICESAQTVGGRWFTFDRFTVGHYDRTQHC